MKQIIDQYGRFLLDALVVSLLMVLLFTQFRDNEGNVGIRNVVGARMNIDSIDHNAVSDFVVLETESAKAHPQFIYDGSGIVETGKVRISDYLIAKDYAGNELAFEIISYTDTSGVEHICGEGVAEITINSPGIYTFQVRAVDSEYRKAMYTVQIPVNAAKA